MSFGAKLYAAALQYWLPQVAPQIKFDFVKSEARLVFTEQIGIPARAALRHVDLIHFTSLPSLLPLRPFVATIHDFHFARFPELLSSRSRLLWETYMRLTLRRARCVIVDDDRTVADCERFAGVPAERCRVIPLGYDPAMLRVSPNRSARPYIIYAGNRAPHKRVDDLISAWRALPDDLAFDLYLTDSAKETHAGFYEEKGRSLVQLGHVSENDIWSYIAGASVYVQPSLAEGFGLPMLEAAVLCVPLVATLECVPSILASTATTYGAGDTRRLISVLESVLRDRDVRERHARVESARARQFTWERCASETYRAYVSVLQH